MSLNCSCSQIKTCIFQTLQHDQVMVVRFHNKHPANGKKLLSENFLLHTSKPLSCFANEALSIFELQQGLS